MANGVELGVGYLTILPEMTKVVPGTKKVLRQIEKDADATGKTMGDSLYSGVKDGMFYAKKTADTTLSGIEKDSKTTGNKVGDNLTRGVGKSFKNVEMGSKGTAKAVAANLSGSIATGLGGADKQSKTAASKISANLSGGARKAFSNVKNTFSGMEREAVSAGRSMGATIGNGIKGGVQTVIPVISGLLVTALAGGGALGSFGIKVAADIEQSEIAFGTLLKSNKRAKKEMAWLTQTAAITPFETSDLITMDKTLLNFGFTSDDVRHKWVLNMGNIAAAVGLPADRLGDMSRLFGQIKASGTISMEDVNQAIDMGIPIWDALGKTTGKTVQQMRKDISDGKFTADTFFKSMDSYTGKNFNNAMKAQSQSITGMWSSVTDNFSMGAANLVTPLVPFIKDIMPKVSGWMTVLGAKAAGVIPKAIQLGQSFKKDVLPGIQDVAATIKDKLLPPLLNIGGFIVTHLPLILGLAGGIAAIAISVKAWTLGVQAFAAVQGLYNGVIAMYAVLTGTATTAQIALNTAMRANVIGLVVLALVGLVAGVIYAYKHFEGFRNVVNTVFAAVATAAQFLWNNVLKPVFNALVWFVKSVIAPTVLWLYTNVIKPYFTLIGAIIKGVWDRFIYPMFQFFSWVIRNVVAPAISWLYNNIVKPVFGAIGKYFSDQWNGKIKPVLVALGGFITGTVAPAIGKGVDKVKSIWEKLQGIFLTPINFLIGTVYNNGIRKVINALPGVDDIAPMALLGGSGPSGGGTPNQRNRGRDMGFAAGGPVTGGVRGKDSVRAWLMPGEHVLTADEVKAAGGQGAIFALRKSLKNGGLGRSFDPDPAFAGGGSLSAAQIKKAKDFAQAEQGSPYVWGASGPGGYDCSGFMSAITNILSGRSPFSRVGATGNFPWSGFDSGPGQFTIGSTKNYGGSGVGHMAGTLDGMNVESRGGRGVVTGSAARGYKDSGFDTVAHLGAAGEDGGFFASIKNILKSLKGWVSELGSMGGFGGLIKQMVQGVGEQFKNYINNKVPGPGPLSGGIFDNGGILQPGQLAFNASNKPEAVFNNKQFAEYANDNKSQAGSGQYAIQITNWEEGTGYMREIAGDEIDASISYRE